MNTKKLSNIFFSLMVLVVVVSACSPVQPGSPDALSLDGTKWDFAGFRSGDGVTPPVANANITLDFADGQVSGSAGCNGYGASYTLDGNTLTFDTEGFASTLMFCEPSEIMDQETQYLTWLQNAQMVALENGQLTVRTSEGDLVFNESQNTALEGTNWQLSGLMEGDALVSNVLDENINIQFENGQVGGSAGCNQFGGSYTLDGDKLTFGPLTQTEMACAEDVNQRESAFLTALSMVASYKVERTTLTLLDASGNLLMSFVAGE